MYCIPDTNGFCERCGKLIPFLNMDSLCGRKKPHGIGSHLKVILRRLGIRSGAGCNCSSNARKINKWNADEAEAGMGRIVEMLKTEAAARGLPFSVSLARLIVRRAISNHREESKRINVCKEAARATQVRVQD